MFSMPVVCQLISLLEMFKFFYNEKTFQFDNEFQLNKKIKEIFDNDRTSCGCFIIILHGTSSFGINVCGSGHS